MKSTTVMALLACAVLAAAAPDDRKPALNFNPQPDPSQRHFGYDVAGGKSHGSPMHIAGQANADAWVSRDGNTRVNVGAGFAGPANHPKINEGRVTFTHRW